jgi:hypothetical protein
MSLIEQLKQTPKWSGFEKWWCDNYFLKVLVYNHINISFECFCSFPFEFQEGVFKKFIEQDSVIAKYRTHYNISVLKEDCLIQDDFNTFEELILWYFNN